MFRRPNSGDGESLSDYPRVIPLFGSAGPGPGVLENEIDPRTVGTPDGRSWSGEGGRWLLWPLRAALWATLRLQSEQVAGIAVQDPRHAVVTLLATVNGQLMELGVPVIASGGGMIVAGEPAWLPAPPRISSPAPSSQGSDPVARAELLNELPAFFQAYAAGDPAALSRFEVRGVSLTGLGGAVAFDSIAGLQVPPGGATRQITATVIWQLPGQVSAGTTELEMAYRMLVRELQSDKWYVNEISAAAEAVGGK
jgi:Conjugative transposon protein TcpC